MSVEFLSFSLMFSLEIKFEEELVLARILMVKSVKAR